MSELSTVGPWARQKLDALEQYLSAYTTIMKSQKWCKGYVYVDAFAGPGEHSLRQYPSAEAEGQILLTSFDDVPIDSAQIEFINGSPRVALSLRFPFTHYVFIEMNYARAKALKKLQSAFPDCDIRIRQSDCNEYLRDRLIGQGSEFWSKWRALVFLDPFGMQVPWSTIQGLAETNGVEILINFPVGMAIQRLLKRDGRFSPEEREKLDKNLGDSSWFDEIYETDQTLFGEDWRKVEQSGHKLVKWYRGNRLKTCFKFVSAARLVRNTRGGHLYYLLHAGQNETGHKIADRILSQGEVIR